ncbi:hypothetical protein EF_1107 [Enterococcus faecalis V583]|uniref:Uncharacterized protein n=1 Tax=Enterococcus faecalis (strain ATCC 700802 / V583) TaxID=226185 RepID=Q836K4_ENTFA|nr:hypothetical protein EF_1107 [Enterococcus faecalis V583]
MTAAQLISWSLFVENEEVILRESEYIFDMRGGFTFSKCRASNGRGFGTLWL